MPIFRYMTSVLTSWEKLKKKETICLFAEQIIRIYLAGGIIKALKCTQGKKSLATNRRQLVLTA